MEPQRAVPVDPHRQTGAHDPEMDREAEDDPDQQRIGPILEVAERMLEAKREQHAHGRQVILVHRRKVAIEQAAVR